MAHRRNRMTGIARVWRDPSAETPRSAMTVDASARSHTGLIEKDHWKAEKDRTRPNLDIARPVRPAGWSPPPRAQEADTCNRHGEGTGSP